MSNTPDKSSNEHNTPAANASTFVITREMFDQVAVYRMRYIAVFIAIFLWWLVTRVMIFFMAPAAPEATVDETPPPAVETTQTASEIEVPPTEEAAPTSVELSMPDFDSMAESSGIPKHVLLFSLILLLILYGTFYYNFAKAARIMGWAWWWIVPSLMVISIPILGILPMGVTDRRLADQWDKADDEHTRYRERVYADDEENEEA